MGHAVANVRRGRKFDQVLGGARRVFMAGGFEGSSVDEIAREAGVSKATLYSYFPDKRLLFIAVARNECRRQADAALSAIDRGQPPRVVLEAAGRHLLGFLTSPFGRRIFRICVAESDRFPDIGREFYATGPAMAHDAIADYLRAAAARGEVRMDDVQIAADQFIELCKADIWLRIIFDVGPEPDAQAIERNVREAVETFMARYGA